MEKETEKTIHTLKKITLEKDEKALLRASLFARIEEEKKLQAAPKPILGAVPSPWYSFVSSVKTRRFQYVLASFLIVILLGSSVALASENALPGDILYPVKTQVTEKISGFFQKHSPEAEANFESKLVEKRLIEAEELSTKNELEQNPILREDVKKEVEDQTSRAEKAQERVSKKAQQDEGKQDEKNTNGNKDGNNHEDDSLQTVIKKHEKILKELDLSSDQKSNKSEHKIKTQKENKR